MSGIFGRMLCTYYSSMFANKFTFVLSFFLGFLKGTRHIAYPPFLCTQNCQDGANKSQKAFFVVEYAKQCSKQLSVTICINFGDKIVFSDEASFQVHRHNV